MSEKEIESNLEIRQFESSDLDKVHCIENDSFPTPWSRNMFRNMQRRDSSVFKVATLNSQVVGYAIFRVELSVDVDKAGYERIGHLLDLAVEREHRREGIGSSLLREIEKYSRSRDAYEIWLEAREGNLTAREFYHERGFKDMGVRRGYYPDGTNAIIMRKKIET